MLEQNALAFPEIDPASGSVRYEHGIGGYLGGQPQLVEYVRSGGHNPYLIPFCYPLGNLLYGRRYDAAAPFGIGFRMIIDALCGPHDDTGTA